MLEISSILLDSNDFIVTKDIIEISNKLMILIIENNKSNYIDKFRVHIYVFFLIVSYEVFSINFNINLINKI